jgi:hypothetical protein
MARQQVAAFQRLGIAEIGRNLIAAASSHGVFSFSAGNASHDS